MSQIKLNIIANFLGTAWTAVMGLAFIPLYIRYIGVEGYGLVGAFAIMLIMLSVLDVGISYSLNREMARFTSGYHNAQAIRDLLYSLEIIFIGLAAIIGLSIWGLSDFLARNWLNVAEIPIQDVTAAFSAMAFIISMRAIEGIYRGTLLGLQRHVWYNSAYAIVNTLRHAGVVGVLAWVAPTIQAFFIWQAIISFLSVVLFATSVNRLLPKSPLRPRFSRGLLTSLHKFAIGMMGIVILGVALTQTDKVLLLRLLPLETFGYYTLAATTASALTMATTPIAQAIFPRLVELFTRDDQAELVSIYHLGAQIVSVLIAPLAILLMFFANGFIFMWSGDPDLADNTAPILSVLVMGTFLNALVWIPSQCQLAHGWTSLLVKVNAVAILFIIPSIFWVVPKHGGIGAAWIWVILNAGLFLISTHIMHLKLLTEQKWRLYFSDILMPFIGAIGVILLAQPFQPAIHQNRLHWVAFFLIAGCAATMASIVLANQIRPKLFRAMAFLVKG